MGWNDEMIINSAKGMLDIGDSERLAFKLFLEQLEQQRGPRFHYEDVFIDGREVDRLKSVIRKLNRFV